MVFQDFYLSLPRNRINQKLLSDEETHVIIAIRGIVNGLCF